MLDFTKLELNTTEPVYQQIAAFVKQQIFLGEAIQGEPLPSRRELAAVLKINPNTVQKAVRLMEAEGFVETPQNAVSTLKWNEAVFQQLRQEQTEAFAAEFASQAKGSGMTLEEAMELLRTVWEKTE